MKLELKHLAPYLPYELKGVNRNGTIFLLHTNTSSGGKLEKREISTFLSEEFKPILRPLSDLTKEIEVNGEKFVPENILNTKFKKDFKDLINYKNNLYSLEKNTKTENYYIIDLYDKYLIYEIIFSWHFDVFGLIEKGLAIDINNLQNE